ncbi:MAG: DUF424 family protein [Candidatus Pacearchaeota archaeon]
MFVKIHKSSNVRTVIAICDSDILGKKFEEGKRQLDIRESFYKGTDMNKPDVLKLMKRQTIEDASFNIVGKESIETALEAGIITKKGVFRISGIPFALVLL